MALGGNPIFNGKSFRGATQAPPVPQAPYGAPYGQAQYGQQPYSQAPYGQQGWNAQPQSMTDEQLRQMYSQPSAGPADTGRMTFDDVIMKTAACLGAVLVGAAITLTVGLGLASMLMIVGALGGFVLALVNTFKKQPSPALILAYAALEGLFLGGLTRILDTQFPGVGLQAVIGTLSVFAVTLVLFKSGKVRATPKAMRFFMIAVIGYAVFALVNMVMMWTGVLQQPFGLRSVEIFGIPLGVFIGLLAIGLAAFSLIMDLQPGYGAGQLLAPEELLSIPQVSDQGALRATTSSSQRPLSMCFAFGFDGIYIGATWAREMRNLMLASLVIFFAAWWALQSLGNAGLWCALMASYLSRGGLQAARYPAQFRATFAKP